jgi:hypothetical protein
MAHKVKIVLNKKAVRDQLLKSSEMQNICEEYAKTIAGRCGEGYASDTYAGKNRVNAMVYAETAKARADNNKNNTILKAVGG